MSLKIFRIPIHVKLLKFPRKDSIVMKDYLQIYIVKIIAVALFSFSHGEKLLKRTKN